MLYLLESDTRNVKWNGIPLHEATTAIIKEQMNGDFILTVRYPITDSDIYQLFREDMLIKAPAPVIGPQLFRIKKPVENDDHLEITAYHITDDVMQRSINPLSVNKQSCWQALSQLVQVAKSPINDFSFTSDITDRRTINTKEVETLYSVLMDGAHSIVGTWEGEMVRDNFAISIKRNRGEDRGVIISTHKNLKSYQRTKNSQNVVTRIHAKSTFKAEGAKEDTTIAITIDSPLIGAYPYINERSYTNNNIQTVDELTKWASAKFTNEHIDKATDAIKIEAYELDGQTVHMGDIVNLKSYKHNVDVYKKAIAYEYDCLANNGQGAYLTITFDDKVKSGGNGGGLSAVANAILDKQETQFDIMLERAIANADRAFDAEFKKRKKEIDDGIELAKAKAEEVKQELSDTINQRFNSFDNGPLQEVKRKAEEALKNAGASSLLAQEAKQIGLDSVARLEAFKSQTTSAQTALSGDLDALKRTIANDIRPKQAQAEAEIAKQVEALVQTKKELAGVKSAQATYEETTTRRLAELTNLANGKASKSELTQTAEELSSKIASVQAGSSRNYFRNSRSRIFTTGDQAVYDYRTFIVPDFWKNSDRLKRNYVRISFDVAFPIALARDTQANVHFSASPWYGYKLTFKGGTTERQHFEFTIDLSSSSENYQTNNVFIRFGTNYGFPADLQVVIENAMLSVGNYFPTYQSAYEDQEDRVSTVESSFKQRADALDAGVSRLTEGLRTKADISSLNVTAENIRQSVKSLETNTQNKLDQKLSMAEFEVQAGSIRQEILNATKDKADKTLVVAEAGKLREELASQVGSGRNLWINSKILGNPVIEPLPDGHITGQKQCYKLTNNQEITFNIEPDFSSRLFRKVTFSAWVKYENVVKGANDWNRFNCFKHYMFFRNSQTGNISGANRPTLAILEGSSDWKRIVFTYDYSMNKGYDQLKTTLRFNLESVKSGVAWIAGIQVEFGSVATDWSPAPEDVDGLITEAKATFERTAQGLRTDLSAIQEYVNKDGQRQEALQRYTREESARQATAVRELVTSNYVGKATYQEDVKGINQKIEAVKTSANKEIASQIASYRQSVDGKFTDISSQITTYKQDVGGQISGLSNRLTSSEQGTTTQISNLSNRINSNKQGTDNQISNLTTQVATNKDNAERQMGRISDQVSANKANADSQFANVSNQLARKVETTDFQRVKETSQLYERIIGTTEDSIADKVARMALTNQLFQVEVSKNEGLKTVQRQLADSWSVQHINSAGDIISGINLGADGRNRFIGKTFHITGETLIDNAVIKSAMVDKLKTANFEAGSVTTTILDAEAVTADKLKVDFALVRKLTANDAFIEQLTSKRIFSAKVESVVSSSTFLEAYQGRIGGFTLGQFDYGGGRWISGVNQFSVGMGNGAGYGVKTAFWANWGNSWDYAGPKAWYVNTDGKMYCRNEAGFYDQVDFSNSSSANFYGNTTFSRSPVFSNGIELGSKDVFGDGWNPKGGRNAVVWWNQVGSGSVKYWMDQESDRRLKENITDTAVKALNKINRLRMVAFDFIESKKHEEIGLIAQEVETIVPRIVSRDPENPDGYLHIDYTALVPYLIKAIQELNQKIEKWRKQ
ncbi:tail fiber PblB-like protein [Streptococcus phage SpSL1]|uniref:Tail fiber PblB-like protein n=1 Tax=Streptococcus phage SpSL1 TaxID=1566990 RepID=A0A0A0YV37_9CAUD|nr:PblB-type receptor binding [Streptococcus phage SpSL1]AIX12926.1 tail fiber PblB-like protein [Streptococcus phage SpSL1]